jgi:hypothetical protein
LDDIGCSYGNGGKEDDERDLVRRETDDESKDSMGIAAE